VELVRRCVRAALWFGPVSGLCLWLGTAALWPSSRAGEEDRVLCSADAPGVRLAQAASPPTAPPRATPPVSAGAPHPAPDPAAEPPAADPPAVDPPAVSTVPGMPPVLDPKDLYSAARTGNFSPAVAEALARVYVPNRQSDSVSVIDPATYRVLETFKVGISPQHVVPSWDLETLWVANNGLRARGGSLTPIDPKTGEPGRAIPVDDPYNLYFTPDGKAAIVVAESLKRLDFRDPHTMALRQSLATPQCDGVNHADFSIDGRYAIFTCEFHGGGLVKIDLVHRQVVGYLRLWRYAMPQDIRVSPDGKVFYVADMHADGVFLIDGDGFSKIGFVHTGVGTHGLYPSRDATRLYVANRGSHSVVGLPHGTGSISVIDFATRKVVATWPIPGGGSPDMGNVSNDGKTLWLSGRFDNVVYAIDTREGAVHKIPVGIEPHGLTVWPQPGRYSLGHTGNMR
jgi:YVTN family beta-propeller protein